MKRIALLLASTMAFATPAMAASTLYTFSAADGTTGSITFNEDTGSTAVTSVTGLIDGSMITGLSGYAGADNTFNPAVPHFSFAGLSVSTSTLGDYNFYFDGTHDDLLNSRTAPTGNPVIGEPFSVITTEVVTSAPTSAVPELASWAMMIAGFGAVGLAMRRRVRISEVRFNDRINQIVAGKLA